MGGCLSNSGKESKEAQVSIVFAKFSGNPVINFTQLAISGDPTVVYEPQLAKPYRMWITGALPGQKLGIVYAESVDGTTFSSPNETAFHLVAGPEAWDSEAVETPFVVKVGNQYKMYFTGYANVADPTTYGIGIATSNDGTTWVKNANQLFLGSEPSVIYENGTYKIWYFALIDGVWGVYYRESTDGINSWSIPPQLVFPYDIFQNNGAPSQVVIHRGNGKYEMYFNTYTTARSTSKAVSSSGFQWNVIGEVLAQGAPGSADAAFATSCAVIEGADGKLRVWYSSWAVDAPANPNQHSVSFATGP